MDVLRDLLLLLWPHIYTGQELDGVEDTAACVSRSELLPVLTSCSGILQRRGSPSSRCILFWWGSQMRPHPMGSAGRPPSLAAGTFLGSREWIFSRNH